MKYFTSTSRFGIDTRNNLEGTIFNANILNLEQVFIASSLR